MTDAFAVRVVDATVAFTRRPFIRPLRLSSGTITNITEARATVTVETPNGQRATGYGAIYLSDLWAWPDPDRTTEERDAAMRAFCEQSAAPALLAATANDPVHPLEAGLRLHASVRRGANASPLPPLARLVCASPFDAALHDAAGRAYNVSAFSLYNDAEEIPIPSADAFFPNGEAIAAIAKMLRPQPASHLNATLVVGRGDALTELDAWAGPNGRGYHVFKIKVGGTNPDEDAARVSAVYRYAKDTCGVVQPRLSVDANCASPDAQTVGAFSEILQTLDGDAFSALEAVEQPTARSIQNAAFDWHGIASPTRPLLLDEGLTDWDDLFAAEKQGWNGLAVKTCRGHSFSLVTAAWAHEKSWKLTVMDLTNPNISAIHSALLAAHLPGVDAIEMNAAQYTPAANAEYLPALAPLLEPQNGMHRLPHPLPLGLGGDGNFPLPAG